eukprot:TRINITY_DN2031_c0_g1_i3.p1 TRINITY_DN2031_c0_g1~~TRINITY_DN2031_c0_g1_i3.p1  ORF type:complete len:155 (+),score=3.13 TRINITY_DN2031_c0_g1_i3:206-670(+)
MSNIFSSQEANVVHYPGDTAQAPLLAALPLLQCQSWHLGTEDILPTVCDVQEPIRIFVVLVHLRHESSSCGGEDAIHEDEDCLLWGEPKTLPNHVHKLSDCQFLRNQVLFAVDLWNVTAFGALTNHRDAVAVLLADFVCFIDSFICAQCQAEQR